jgi:hypothetical protein
MKILWLTSTLAAMTIGLHAQGMVTQEMRVQVARSGFAARPSIRRGGLDASAFWTKPTIALVLLDGAAKATDSFATRRNIDGGGAEYDVLARPFVHTSGVQVAAMTALFGAEIAIAYALHHRHHGNLGRAVLVGGAVMNGLGAAESYRRRVASW